VGSSSWVQLYVQRETRCGLRRERARLTERIRELLRSGRGRSLSHTIENLNRSTRLDRLLHLTQSKGILEDLDGGCGDGCAVTVAAVEATPDRQRKLRGLGLDAERAWLSAVMAWPW